MAAILQGAGLKWRSSINFNSLWLTESTHDQSGRRTLRAATSVFRTGIHSHSCPFVGYTKREVLDTVGHDDSSSASSFLLASRSLEASASPPAVVRSAPAMKQQFKMAQRIVSDPGIALGTHNLRRC